MGNEIMKRFEKKIQKQSSRGVSQKAVLKNFLDFMGDYPWKFSSVFFVFTLRLNQFKIISKFRFLY